MIRGPIVEDWVHRALQRWPNVPALFGWLGLDRRGRWTIKGELISRPQIIDVINANYAADEQGRWYFQNGPQRGYVTLAVAPLVLFAQGDDGDALLTHTQHTVNAVTAAWLDETGAMLLDTEHGPGLVAEGDLAWVLARLSTAAGPLDENALDTAIAAPDGTETALRLSIGHNTQLHVVRLDQAAAPAKLGFVLDPPPD